MLLRQISAAIETAMTHGAAHVDLDAGLLRNRAEFERAILIVRGSGLRIEINGSPPALALLEIDPSQDFHGSRIRVCSGVAPNFITLVLTR